MSRSEAKPLPCHVDNWEESYKICIQSLLIPFARSLPRFLALMPPQIP
jgi:hypothetical protein